MRVHAWCLACGALDPRTHTVPRPSPPTPCAFVAHPSLSAVRLAVCARVLSPLSAAFEWFESFQTALPGSEIFDKGVWPVADIVTAFADQVSKDALPSVTWIVGAFALSGWAVALAAAIGRPGRGLCCGWRWVSLLPGVCLCHRCCVWLLVCPCNVHPYCAPPPPNPAPVVRAYPRSPSGPTALSEHAENHPADGEDLSARLLAVLADPANAAVYAKTVFILNYDEGGQVRCGGVWFVVWCAVVCCGVVCCGVLWCGVQCCAVVCCSVLCCAVRSGAVRCGSVPCGAVAVRCGLVLC